MRSDTPPSQKLSPLRGAALAILVLLVGLAAPGHIADMRAQPTLDMIEVEPGRRLHAACEGPTTAPLVLYDAGAFGIYTDGWWIREALKTEFRVCLYDRAGMGWSDPPPAGQAPTPSWHVDDMRRLARAVGAEPPWFLVGHSMAGLRMHAYANAYPEDLAGLVFVDAAAPRGLDSPRIRRLIGVFRAAMTIGGLTARTGLARVAAPLMPDELDLPIEQLRDKRRSISWVRHHKAAANEIGAAVAAGAEAYAGDRAAQIPIAAFTNSEGGGANAVFVEAARAATGYGRLDILPDETHVSFLNQRGAQRIAEAVREMWALQSAEVSAP